MQIDMHYFGTYAIARAAGLIRKAAEIIATSAQFVDDNVARNSVKFKNGARIDQEATAHHPMDIENRDDRDQRQVWVPFHFLPGNEGDGYTERLKCRMDSRLVNEMIDHHLELSHSEFALHLLGIVAHVYVDTFSHYGFSGISSRRNKVVNSSVTILDENKIGDEILDYLKSKKTGFFEKRGIYGGLVENIKGRVAEIASGALGHGAVATYPDRPFLVWSFEYEDFEDALAGKTSSRNNPETYLAGCKALHEVFSRFATQEKNYNKGDARAFDEISEVVNEILQYPAKKEDRVQAWRNAAREGKLFGEEGEIIPEYQGDDWNQKWEQWADSDELDDDSYEEVIISPIWHFYQAAAVHRTYVLRELLPKYGLIID